MAKNAGASKPVKPTREEKKAARKIKRASRRETFRQLRETFTITRKADSKLIPLLVIAFVVTTAVLYLVLFLIFSSTWLPIIPALLFGVLAAFVLFGRRAQASLYAQADGQPGAAGWLLQNQLKGDWRVSPAVVGNAQLDAVHRLVGRPGVVLVGEGSPARVRGLIAQEKKKLSRLTGETPIYDIVVGSGSGEVSLAKLSTHLRKLPPNLTKDQVSALDRRLQAMSSTRAPLPQGPMPAGAKMRNVQRAARRKSST
ncbi:protein of unknown function [Frankineae bacterium MT45]|nr:protein of unknown function [Frankineae bacterium MT45]